MNTLEFIPTWEALIGPMIAVLQNENASYTSQRIVQENLILLAKIADDASAERAAQIAEYEKPL
jgi:hypothetical protein